MSGQSRSRSRSRSRSSLGSAGLECCISDGGDSTHAVDQFDEIWASGQVMDADELFMRHATSQPCSSQEAPPEPVMIQWLARAQSTHTEAPKSESQTEPQAHELRKEVAGDQLGPSRGDDGIPQHDREEDNQAPGLQANQGANSSHLPYGQSWQLESSDEENQALDMEKDFFGNMSEMMVMQRPPLPQETQEAAPAPALPTTPVAVPLAQPSALDRWRSRAKREAGEGSATSNPSPLGEKALAPRVAEEPTTSSRGAPLASTSEAPNSTPPRAHDRRFSQRSIGGHTL